MKKFNTFMTILKLCILFVSFLFFYGSFLSVEASELTNNSALPRVIFLSSFKEEIDRPDLSQQLESMFSEYFDNEKFELAIHHNADKFDLWNALHSSRNIAVFWVSHANSEIPSLGSSIGGDVLDVSGANVSTFFSDIAPNILWVGLVGCNTRNLINRYRLEDSYLNNPHLIIDSFDSKIEIIDGVRRSLQNAITHLNNSLDYMNPKLFCSSLRKINGLTLNITREIPLTAQKHELTSVSLEKKGHVLLVFPAGQAGELQKRTTILPIDDFNDPSEYTLVLSTGRKSEETGSSIPALGKLIITSQIIDLKWEAFMLNNDHVVGRNRNVYLLPKKLDLSNIPNILQEPTCLE